MGYSIDPLSADCYEGTTCLINKFDIRDEKKLASFETIITSAKCGKLEKEPINGNFDFSQNGVKDYLLQVFEQSIIE